VLSPVVSENFRTGRFVGRGERGASFNSEGPVYLFVSLSKKIEDFWGNRSIIRIPDPTFNHEKRAAGQPRRQPHVNFHSGGACTARGGPPLSIPLRRHAHRKAGRETAVQTERKKKQSRFRNMHPFIAFLQFGVPETESRFLRRAYVK